MKKLTLILLLVFAAETIQAQGFIKKQDKDTLTMNNNAMACLLTDADLAQRKNALQTQIFSKVKKVEEANDGYLFHFDGSDSLLLNLFNYILAEKKCCPFFQQDISVKPDNSGIVWKISGEDGIKEMLTSMFDKIPFPEN